MTTCLHCHRLLVWLDGVGFVHQDGGGLYWMTCSCGWHGSGYPSPTKCPKCGSRQLRDHHCAIPDRSGGKR